MTLNIKSTLQLRVLAHKKENNVSESDYKTVRPLGSYGLPKVRKLEMPLGPLLSMINSPQHKLAVL